MHTVPKWTELWLDSWWRISNSGINELFDEKEVHCMFVADFVADSRSAGKGPGFYLADLADRWRDAHTQEDKDSAAGYLVAEMDLGLLAGASMHEILLLLPDELRQRADEIIACRDLAFADRG